jgi:protein-tyrosine phosphatase
LTPQDLINKEKAIQMNVVNRIPL